MKCPFCGNIGDKVVDSRESKEGNSIRRRRECLACSKRYHWNFAACLFFRRGNIAIHYICFSCGIACCGMRRWYKQIAVQRICVGRYIIHTGAMPVVCVEMANCNECKRSTMLMATEGHLRPGCKSL